MNSPKKKPKLSRKRSHFEAVSRASPSTSGNEPPAKRKRPDYSKEIYSEFWYRNQRRESANIVDLLRNRELGCRRRYPQHKLNDVLYTALPMNKATISDRMFNNDYIVSWTPDGKHLVCYARSMDAVRVYYYKGVQNINNKEPPQCLQALFELDFQVFLHHRDTIKPNFIQFSSCGRFFILATSCFIERGEQHGNDALYVNNECVPHVAGSEHLSVQVVDLQKKLISSNQRYPCFGEIDPLTCISLSGNFLLVTSVHMQVMFVSEIEPSGILMPIKDIGPAISNSHEVYALLAAERRNKIKNKFFTAFKQRVMTFLYKRARQENKLIEMHRSSGYVTDLRMYQTALFEEHYIFIRMYPKDHSKHATDRSCFFVVMDWRDCRIVDIFDEFDDRFLKWTKWHIMPLAFPLTSPAWVRDTNFAQHTGDVFRLGMGKLDRKYNDETRRVFLNMLPFRNNQQYQISLMSPYLDKKLYNLGWKRIIPSISNGKLSTTAIDSDLTFTVVRTQKISFRMCVKFEGEEINVLALLFHPEDPLVIGFDRSQIPRGRTRRGNVMDPGTILYHPAMERE